MSECPEDLRFIFQALGETSPFKGFCRGYIGFYSTIGYIGIYTYRGYRGVLLGLYRDNGKENGAYYLGFRVWLRSLHLLGLGLKDGSFGFRTVLRFGGARILVSSSAGTTQLEVPQVSEYLNH